ncbi:MAG: M20/M25/M40 family metallo-hydrolase [bacterium]|nr:M20/M25/M40 family metallo-hydrolase [bacterium]
MKKNKDTVPTAESALAILQQLIRIRTNHTEGYEMDAVKYISSLFSAKIESSIIDHGNNRGSLIVEIKGQVPDKKIAIFGYLDTVKNIGMDSWEHPPFSADYVNGAIHGKGAANMKGGVTSAILVMTALSKTPPPPLSVLMCLTADGTGDGLGAIEIAEKGYLKGVIEAIFTNATREKIGISQKGALWIKVEVTGTTSYSASPASGTNAVEALILFCQRLRKAVIGQKNKKHLLLGLPSCTITQFNSGTGEVNQIPPYAAATIDIRFMPYQDPEAIINLHNDIARELSKTFGGINIKIEVLKVQNSVYIPENSAMVKRFSDTLLSMNKKSVLTGLNIFGDAAHVIPRTGVPFLIYGPGEYSSAVNEKVSLKSVISVANVLVKYIQNYDINF